MTTKSRGFRQGTRKKLRKASRTPITKYLQSFSEGEPVVILPEPASHSGMPFPRFKGCTGRIAGRRGRAYVVSFMDGDKRKTLLVKPEHLSRLR